MTPVLLYGVVRRLELASFGVERDAVPLGGARGGIKLVAVPLEDMAHDCIGGVNALKLLLRGVGDDAVEAEVPGIHSKP